MLSTKKDARRKEITESISSDTDFHKNAVFTKKE